MSLKRLFPVLVLPAVVAAIALSNATAGVGIADEPCPNAAGENTNTCPVGQVGVPYTIQFKEAEGSGCGPGLQTFTIDSGTFPPGLTLSSEGIVSGTPTQAGMFKFYVKIAEPPHSDTCSGSVSEKEFTIPINPAVPKLTIGPETTSPGTVGSPYSLPMTATLSDPKTWSIVDGALPPGLTLGASDGVISGTPTAAGTFAFTVLAVIDAERSDTKALEIIVREQLALTALDEPESEVGALFRMVLAASGGSLTYTWTPPTVGTLPPGLTFGTDGTITGRPTVAGKYRFTVSIADTEDRTASYSRLLTVAPRLAIATKRLRIGKVRRVYTQKVVPFGGIDPTCRIKRGPLPRGIRFDRTIGAFVGTPVKAGTWLIQVECVDALRVKATATLPLTVRK